MGSYNFWICYLRKDEAHKITPIGQFLAEDQIGK